VTFLLIDNIFVKSMGIALGVIAILFVSKILLKAFFPRFYNWIIDVRIIFGLCCGLFVGLFVGSYYDPLQIIRGTYYTPHYDVLDTYPANGDTLRYVHGVVLINFSRPVRDRFCNRKYINVEITPHMPIKLTWLYKIDPNDGCRTLSIASDKYFPNIEYPQFEPNKTYRIRVTGPLLVKPYEMVFHTPEVLVDVIR
jgi:hypothetical protein